jgi:glycosyltransferase involved in cell wall biosynthesis
MPALLFGVPASSLFRFVWGGTRLKVLEAMVMKKPVVTTSVGCEGMDVVNEESVLIRDELEAFAQGVIELFQNPLLRQRIVSNSYELMRERYDWSAISHRLEELYCSLAGRTKKKGYFEAG